MSELLRLHPERRAIIYWGLYLGAIPFLAWAMMLVATYVTPALDTWREAKRSAALARPIQHEAGLAYRLELPGILADGDTDEVPRRSTLVLCEDDRPLGPAHSDHEEIRTSGGGRFSHWHDWIIFSSSDRSDPRHNSRAYWVSPDGACTTAPEPHL
jgi:hypothetical protein